MPLAHSSAATPRKRCLVVKVYLRVVQKREDLVDPTSAHGGRLRTITCNIYIYSWWPGAGGCAGSVMIMVYDRDMSGITLGRSCAVNHHWAP